jgi:hypothetical protein
MATMPRRRTATVQQVAIDVSHLPEAARQLGDLTQRERDVLALLREGLASREIAERLVLSEATVCLVIADLLDALEYKPPAASADEIHRRARTRPASQPEVTRFHQQFGPFDTDSERWAPDVGTPGRARVRFDPDALADDLARLSPPGQTALRHAHDRFERQRVPLDRLRACQDEHRAGTSLPGLP